VLISWGQPLHKNGPAFDPSGNGTAKAQEVQFGDNNDGMSLFEFPGDRNRALMAINNEYTNYRYLYPTAACRNRPKTCARPWPAKACR
jgi:secreted PhoX family phosphatase